MTAGRLVCCECTLQTVGKTRASLNEMQGHALVIISSVGSVLHSVLLLFVCVKLGCVGRAAGISLCTELFFS